MLTQEKFLEKAKLVHGDRYDYSKVVYRGCNKEIIVIDKQTGKEKIVKPGHFLYIDNRYVKKTNKEKADIFIKKSKEKFGNKFDYSKVEYVDSKTPVTLISKEYGEFTIDMYHHLRLKNGYCDKSKVYHRVRVSDCKKLSTDYIIKRCQYIYGDRYDYSKVEYKGGNSKTEVVEIICPIHGSFFKKYENILKRDCGCPKCSKEKAKDKKKLSDIITNGKKFIERSKKKFGDRFDYSEVKYVDVKTPITLICKKHLIKFNVTPNNHLNAVFGGCGKCYNEYIESTKKVKSKLTKEEKRKKIIEYKKKHFIENAIKKFGNRYDYSEVKYVDCKTPVNIIDKMFNNEVFSIKPYNFLHSARGRKDNSEIKTKKFIKKAKKIHGDRYDYSKVEYIDSKTKVCIICPEHGEFWQTPHNHLITRNGNCGCDCPKCSNAVSKLENDIINRLTEEKIKFKKEYTNKELFGRMRGDFYIKSCNVIIECQGSQHFEESNKLHNSYGGSLSGQIERDYNFSKCCKNANIKLFYYFDDDNVKNVDYLNDKKFKNIYTESNTFTNVDSLVSCIKKL